MGMARHRTPELMDDPALDAGEHRAALRELARLNRVTRVEGLVWAEIRPLAQQLSRPLTVLDVATGSADLLVQLASRAKAEGLKLELCGCDMSDVALEAARASMKAAGAEVSLLRLDVLTEPLPAGFDVAHCGLFLHHFDPPEVEHILQRMSQAASTVIVQDLRRSRLGLAMAWAVPRVLSRSKVVQIDAVRSVQGAYTIEEMRGMAERAGLAGADVRTAFPERQLLVWHRP
jgi:2-polyprenyl-3-methyl-5-hydroxy-6-metoxy-1,4-benzoquinol methylase